MEKVLLLREKFKKLENIIDKNYYQFNPLVCYLENVNK